MLRVTFHVPYCCNPLLPRPTSTVNFEGEIKRDEGSVVVLVFAFRKIETPRELLEVLTEKGAPHTTQSQTSHVTINHLQTSA